MRFVTPMAKASAPANMTVDQSLIEIKLRIARLERTVEDHIRLTTATLYQAKELWKPCWMPVQADGAHFSPDHDGWYLVSVLNEADQPQVECDFYDRGEDRFDANDWPQIKAWAEMPKPYQETN